MVMIGITNDQNGNKCTGWVYVKNQWYLLNNDGVMQTGWQRVSGKWYYLDESGQRVYVHGLA